MQPSVTILDNVHIVTMNTQWDEYPQGALAFAGGNVLAVSQRQGILAQFPAATVLDGKGKLLLPGFINAHTHVAMAYFKGLADDLVLQTWLQEHIWPAEAKFLGTEFVHHATLQGAAEMLRGGTTTFHDMYFYEPATARACAETGIRGVLGEGILSMPVHGHHGAEDTIAYTLEQARLHAGDPLVRFELAPHAIYTCTEDDLRKVAAAAREHNLRVHIHLSETEQELTDCLRQHSKRPVQYLQELGLLGPHVMLAHGVWVDDEEAAILAETGTAVAICTRSNLKLASGFAPVHSYVKHGVKLCLGTDSVASNNTLSMFSEMSLLARLHKTLTQDPTFLPAREVVAMCTRHAAEAMQRSNIGVLEPGRSADFSLLRLDDVSSMPVYDVYSHIVYALEASAVQDVFVQGEPVLRDGHLTRVDEAELLRRAQHYRREVAGR